MSNQCKEFSCELVTMLENIPENRPLYKDSGLWQVRTDDMEDVIFEQGVNESFFDFIKRVYDKENSFMVVSMISRVSFSPTANSPLTALHIPAQFRRVKESKY